MLAPEQQTQIVAKPSLLSTTDQNTEESVRILDFSSFGGNSRVKPICTRRNVSRLAIVLGVVAIASAGVVVNVPELVSGMLGKNKSHAPYSAAGLTLASNVSVVKPAAAVLAPKIEAPAPTAVPAPTETAEILTEETPVVKPVESAKTDTSEKLTAALEAGIKPRSALLKSALEASPIPVKVKPAHHAPMVNRAAMTKHADDFSGKAAKPKVKAGKGDSDVSLIAALVAHDTESDEKPAGKVISSAGKSQKITLNKKAEVKRKPVIAVDKVIVQPVVESSASSLDN